MSLRRIWREGESVQHRRITKKVKNGGVCIRHGAMVKQCNIKGCANRTVQGRVCIVHGVKTKQCNREGCTNNALRQGVCCRHCAYSPATTQQDEVERPPPRRMRGERHHHGGHICGIVVLGFTVLFVLFLL